MTNIAQELTSLEKRRKSWMTRLTRAHNAIKALDRTRARLLKKQEAAVADRKLSTEIVAAPPKVESRDYDAIEAMAKTFVENGMAAQKAVDDLTIPKDLRVTADVEALRAERRKKEADERKKMPLTDKDAMKYIKAKKK